MTFLSPEQAWDAMSDQEKIDWLAVNVMGWESDGGYLSWFDSAARTNEDAFVARKDWNPLTDWNAWRQVEGVILSDKYCVPYSEIGERYLSSLLQKDYKVGLQGMKWFQVYALCRADLPTRAKALYLAFQSLQ